MPYIIEILFDPHSETHIRTIWQTINNAGLPSPLIEEGYRPHLTLIVYDTPGFNMARCRSRLEELTEHAAPFPITINHIGLFSTLEACENVVFLGVVPTQSLLSFHRATATLCQEEIREIRPFYHPDAWTPHITLGFNLTQDQAQSLFGMSWEIPLPFTAYAKAVQLVEVTSEGSKEHFLCPLRGAE